MGGATLRSRHKTARHKTQDARKEREENYQRSAEHSSLVSSVLPSSVLLTRLVALNHERAAEEKRGLIRWLRPDYQNKTAETSDGHRPTLQQTTLPGTEAPAPKSSIENLQSPIGNLPWPNRLPDQVTLIRQLLTTDPTATPEQLSNRFGRKNAKRTEQIEGILETLRGLGRM